MFASLLFLFGVFSSSKFDRYEKVHSTKRNCPTSNSHFILLNEDNEQFHFTDCTTITSVEINDSSLVSGYEISDYLFAGSSITKVTFNLKNTQSLTIGEGAFSHCESLSEFALPRLDLTISLEDGAFFNCPTLKTFEITINVTSIGSSCFERCSGLKPKFTQDRSQALTINSYAFYGIQNIGEANFDLGSDLKVYQSAFAGCTGLKFSRIVASYIGSNAFQGCTFENLQIKCGSIQSSAFEGTGSVSWFETNTSITIQSRAFYGLTIQTPLIFNKSYIKGSAFASCTYAQNADLIQLKNTEIGPSAFADQKNFNGRVVLIECSVGQGAFQNGGSFTLQLIVDPDDENRKEENISPKLVINEKAFYNSKVHGDLVIPSFYELIGKRAFASCTELKGNLLVDHVATISPFAFENYAFEKEIRIIDSNIKESAFERSAANRQITGLVIGYERTDSYEDEEVDKYEFQQRTISARAFYNLNLNGPLVIHSSISTIAEYAFSPITISPINIDIFAHFISSFAFKAQGTISNLNIYSNKVQFHAFDGCTIGNLVINTKNGEDANLDEQSFYGLQINRLELGSTCSVGKAAFQECKFTAANSALIINAGSVDEYAFACCQSSTSCTITISSGTKIEKYAFMNFSNIQTLTFTGTSGSGYIGDYAFYGSGLVNAAPLEFPAYSNKNKQYPIGHCSFANITTLRPTLITIKSNVGDKAFYNCAGIQRFQLNDDNIDEIGKYAFYGTSLTGNLEVPSSCTKIDNGAFQGLANLGTITIRSTSKLGMIGAGAFKGSGISGDLHLTPSVEYIYEYAFAECTKLTSIIFYHGSVLRKIDKYAFYNCNGLNCNLDLPHEVKKIGEYAFAGCTNIRGHMVLNLDCEIGTNAFQNCGNIQSIAIENLHSGRDIEIIHPNSFKGLNVFGDITIPSTVKIIGESAFEGCQNIGSVSFTNEAYDSEIRIIGDRAFCNSSISGNIFIPISISSIGVSAFEGCQNLESIIFRNNQNAIDGNTLSIGSHAFYCSGMIYISFHPYEDEYNKDILVQVGDYACANCSRFQHLLGIKNVQLSIGTFENCTKFGYGYNINNLTDYNNKLLPDELFDDDFSKTIVDVTNSIIGPFTFRGCTNFTGKIVLNEGSILSESAFEGLVSEGFVLEIKDFETKKDEELTKKVAIGTHAFYGSSLLGPLTIPKSVRYVGREAFSNCKDINGSLTIETNDVREGAFSYSSFSGKLTINAQLGTSFSEKTFIGCTGFNELDLQKLSSIPARAFYEMSSLKGILIIPKSIEFIGEYAFARCGFTEVYLKNIDDKIEIQRGAFSGIPEMNEITFLDDESSSGTYEISTRGDLPTKKISEYMFYENINMNTFKFSSNYIYEIGNFAFYGCRNLQLNFNLKDIKSIGISAFEGCISFTGTLLIPKTLTRIDDRAFAGCTGLSGSLTIKVTGGTQPTNVQTVIGAEAFKGCKGFEKGTLSIFVENNENYLADAYSKRYYYGYDYFLRIGHDAFKDCKFKNIYYNGRFQPDCDHDLGFSHTKGIKTSSNYANKTFCSYPLHNNKLSGGAIAGIVIACIVVVAAIVIVVVFLILRNKKNKDQSEGEVEMNADP